MKKRLFIVIIAMVGCFFFSACNKNSETKREKSDLLLLEEMLEDALQDRMDKVQSEIEEQQEIKEQHENDLEYYLSDWYLEEEADKHHFIRPGENSGN